MKNFIKLVPAVILLVGLTASLCLCGGAVAQDRTLYWGVAGDDVRKVQYRLYQWGYYDGPIDGVYGPETWQAVRRFQSRNGLSPTGRVNERTWEYLGFYVGRAERESPPTPATSSRIGISAGNDVYLLAKVIAGEARGEPYLGKVAVGSVILNRVQSAAFPNTLAGVIYQPRAFESVANGQYARPVDQESLRAAIQAMNGWDPTNGALFFWNPAKDVSPWIWSRNITMRLGKHVFGV